VQSNADVNGGCTNGTTALFLASSSGKFKTCEILLAQNADPLMKTSKGISAIQIAEEKGFEQVIALLKGEPIPEIEKDPQMAQLENMLSSISKLTEMKQGTQNEMEQMGLDPLAILKQQQQQVRSMKNETQTIPSMSALPTHSLFQGNAGETKRRVPTASNHVEEISSLRESHSILLQKHEDLKLVVNRQQNEINELRNQLESFIVEILGNVN